MATASPRKQKRNQVQPEMPEVPSLAKGDKDAFTDHRARNTPGKTGNELTPALVYIAASLANVGGFLTGYNLGIVGGAMLFIQPYFEVR